MKRTMSLTRPSDNQQSTFEAEAVDLEQYVAISVGSEDSEVLMFDELLSTAWIQSDVSVGLDEVT